MSACTQNGTGLVRSSLSSKVVIYRRRLLPRSETFICAQARALRRWLPVLVGYTREEHGLSLEGLPVVFLGASHKPGARLAATMRFWSARPDPAAVRVLKKTEARLVHAHFGTEATDIWPSVQAARLPMLVTLHGFDINIHREWWESGHGGLRRRGYPRRLLRMANQAAVDFIAVSEAIRQRAIEYGIPAEKVTVAHIGVDTERFKPGGLPLTQRRRRILFVGRMVEKKGPLLMVRIFAQVRDRVPDAELVMVGNGPLRTKAERLALDLEVPVSFTGAQSSHEVLAHLHEARVFCLPSVTAENGDAEGFGLVVLEAQACGVPVVTSALGGATEGILHERTGYRCAERDVDDLADRVANVLQDDELALSLSGQAVKYVGRRFNLADCITTLERQYDCAVGIHM